MAEFDCSTDTMKESVPYPADFQPEYQSVCGSDESGIVLVDGKRCKLMTFNPDDKRYGAAVSMPEVGNFAASMMINGNAHIFHGQNNSDNQYLVHSMNTGQITEFKGNVHSPAMRGVSFTQRTTSQMERVEAKTVCEYWMRTLLRTGNMGYIDVLEVVTRFYFADSEFYKFGGCER